MSMFIYNQSFRNFCKNILKGQNTIIFVLTKIIETK